MDRADPFTITPRQESGELTFVRGFELATPRGLHGLELTFVRSLDVRRRMKPFPVHARQRRRRLADDLELVVAAADQRLDPDCEIGAWPELIDQSKLGAVMADSWHHEDDEIDDDDTGIEDEDHDARDEDGI